MSTKLTPSNWRRTVKRNAAFAKENKALRESHKELHDHLEHLVNFIQAYGIRDRNGLSMMEDLGFLSEESTALENAKKLLK